MDLHRKGKRSLAESIYRQVLDAEPDNSDVAQLYGLLLGENGDYEGAERMMRRSLVTAPGQPHVHNNLGNVLMKLERVDDAVASYRAATGVKKDYAEAWHNLGLALRASDRHDDAIEAFELAIAIKPNYHQAYNSLGSALKDEERLDEAIAAFHKALEISPDYLKALHNLAVALRLSGQLEEAVACYRGVLKADPDIAEAHYNLANALQLLEQVDEAEASYVRALEIRPSFEEAHYDLNQLLWTQGRHDKFLGSYAAAIQRKPESLSLWLGYVEKLIPANALAPAEETLRKALDRFGPTAELYDLLAKTLSRQRREEEALAIHQQCLELDEYKTQYLLDYADTLLRIREFEAALEIMHSACGLDPLDQELIAYKGDCWRFLGDEQYGILNDYDSMVRVYKLPMPDGYNDIAAFTRDLNRALDPVHSATRLHPMDQTVRGGSQSYESLFDKDIELVRLYKQSLERAVRQYIGEMERDMSHPLFSRKCDKIRFTGSFSVRLRNNGYHTNHVHPAGWLSSCFYVSLPPVVADKSRREGWIHFGQPGARFDPPIDPMRHVQPREGVVAIFPSYMWHGTIPFNSDHTRTTVVADIVPDTGLEIPVRATSPYGERRIV